MKNKFRRVFLVVLDSLGIGGMPDAADYGDEGSNTLRSLTLSGELSVPNLRSLGLFNIPAAGLLSMATDAPCGAYGALSELSRGKDTTVGHWEIAGIVSPRPLPTYPNGFPASLLEEFSHITGRGWLCNLPYSGTEVIRDYGEEHLKTGKLIIYTSADSVFQIAAHEEIVPPETLYEYCAAARRLLCGENGVGRVIARPFEGGPGNFVRTANRRDFSIQPPGTTILDAVKDAGMDVISVGKIRDIFAGRGITEAVITHGNAEGEKALTELAKRDFNGLCFVNLVDFDMLYGHRNDVDGYAAALTRFDRTLGELLPLIGEDDVLLLTADHGCDPATPSTDHSRERVFLLVYGKRIIPTDIGIRSSFSDIAATIAESLGCINPGPGTGFLSAITRG
ncbi:MAG: phosphopentomutase [Eubacteriales bacterium]